MNMQKTDIYSFKHLAISGLTALLVACGGGSSDDDPVAGSSPVVARGVITQLGSIYVNGVKYETPSGGSYSDDDSSSGVANYKVGQVVSIRGRRNDDGVTGTADEVEYEAEIEGEAQGGEITGVKILLTPSTNTSGATLNTGDLMDNQRYEVSGIWIDDSLLEATFLKDDDDIGIEDEIKGKVQAVSAGVSLEVRDITFNFTGTPIGGSSINLNDLVEVHFDPGTCSGTSPDIICDATRVEIEDDFFDQAEGLEIEFEGAVDKFPTDCPAQAEFKVDGICVDSDSKPAEWFDGLTQFDDMVQGSRVEVEGHMVSTPSSPSLIKEYLRADKVKGRGNRVRVSSIAGNVQSVPPCTFEVVEGNIIVEIADCATGFEGDASTSDPLDITNLLGEEIEVRGISTGLDTVTGKHTMTALRVKASGLSGGGDRHEIRAEVDLGGASANDPADEDRITVMGITAVANGFTELEIEDTVIAPGNGVSPSAVEIDTFLDMIDDNSDPSDGPRDVVEIGFDITTGNGTTSPYTAEEIEIQEEDD